MTGKKKNAIPVRQARYRRLRALKQERWVREYKDKVGLTMLSLVHAMAPQLLKMKQEDVLEAMKKLGTIAHRAYLETEILTAVYAEGFGLDWPLKD